MANVINATSTGNGGLVSTGDDSGILNIQTNETTAITVDASQRVAFVAGTAALPAITTAGDTNTGIYFPAADTIAFSEGGAESMRIDSSGNVGIGVTPSSWSGSRALQLSNGVGVSSVNGSNNTQFTNNAYWNGSGWIYIASDYANKYSQVSGTHIWYTASSGTAGNAVTFNESMRIDSSGNLLVGQTSSTDGGGICVSKSVNGSTIANFYNNFGSGSQTLRTSMAGAASNTSSYHIVCASGADKFFVYGNGNVVNSNNSYGTLSDVKLKENIVDASSKLSEVMQLKVRNFNLKTEPDHKQIGFIAQELEQVFPALIDNTTSPNDPDDVIKSIKTSVLVPILVKAIQELKAINDTQAETINALTARIVALEGQ